MLALNKGLQKMGELIIVWFGRIKNLQSGAISALLTKKTNAKKLLETRKNILIQAIKTVDITVIAAEVLEY